MRFIRILLLLIFVLPLAPIPVQAQTSTPPPGIRLILDQMTPEERVGQLFLVTFKGMDTSSESQIYDLVTNYHVGGVMLMSENDNFCGTDTIVQANTLIDELQRQAWDRAVNHFQDPQPGQMETSA